MKKGVTLQQAIANALSTSVEDGATFTHIEEPEFAYQLIKLEEKHRQVLLLIFISFFI